MGIEEGGGHPGGRVGNTAAVGGANKGDPFRDLTPLDISIESALLFVRIMTSSLFDYDMNRGFAQ